MSGGVAIFVKTPGVSPLKTRLAAGIGRAAAEQWYRLAADAVASAASIIPGLSAYWAVAERAAVEADAWAGLEVIEQSAGELGARMGHIHDALMDRHDFALLLGADTPQLSPAILAEATEWLASDEPRLVMGPARDGGFWLLGSNRRPHPGDWVAAPCGRPDTAAGFQEAMHRHGAWRTLPMLTDVDEAGDLALMLAELDRLAAPSPQQQRLSAWTRSILPEAR
jgi:uncharacterized protein